MRGLRDRETRRYVQLNHPKTLDEAIALASNSEAVESLQIEWRKNKPEFVGEINASESRPTMQGTVPHRPMTAFYPSTTQQNLYPIKPNPEVYARLSVSRVESLPRASSEGGGECDEISLNCSKNSQGFSS